MPRVSVIIPCHNQSRYLPESVGSALGQTCRDVEVIIVDDGSTDETAEVARSLVEGRGDQRLRFMSQVKSGAPAARNAGVMAAQGEYVLPLDADDLLRPEYVEKTLRAVESEPQASLSYTWTEKSGTETGIIKPGGLDRRSVYFLEGPPTTMLIKKSVWTAVGGHSPRMKRGGQDWEFNMRLYEAGHRGVLVPEPLFVWRRHAAAMSKRVLQANSLFTQRTLKLLHPRLYERRLSGISITLARAVIWLKAYTRDPIMHYLYVKHPEFHAKLRSLKYGLFRAEQ